MAAQPETQIESFRTDTGLLVPAVTAERMREVDRIAVEETGPNLFQMMENAGRSLAELAMELLGDDWRSAGIVVLAGPGGNGGGGICAARHLANRGARVSVRLSSPDRLGDVPAWQRKVYLSAGGREAAAESLDAGRPALVVDALIGYSLRAAPHGAAGELIRWANATGVPALSLDVPSGVDATTGETPGGFIRARWTMTLALPKTGLHPETTGELILADIGIPAAAYQRAGIRYTPPFDRRFRVPLKRIEA